MVAAHRKATYYLFVGTAAVAILGALVAIFLSTNLVLEDGDLPALAPLQPSLLTKRQAQNGETVYQKHLHLISNLPVSQIGALNLLMATYARTVDDAHVQLRSEDGNCLFAAHDAVIRDNKYLLLARNSCREPANDSWVLEIQARSDADIALWVGRLNTNAQTSVQILTGEGKEVPSGTYLIDKAAASAAEPMRLIDLIDRIWGIGSTGVGTLTKLLVLGILLIIAGMLVTSLISSPGVWVCGYFLVASGICLIYSFAIPPFQAPDEANHFITLLDVTQRSYQQNDALQLANNSHYERLMCRVHEKFSVTDSYAPRTGTWPKRVHKTTMDLRSPLGKAYWQLIGSILPHLPVNTLHLVLRNINGLVFLTLISLAILIMRRKATEFDQMVASTIIFTIPTLFLFVSHVSNHVLLIVAYAISALLTARIFRSCWTVKESAALGCILGLALSSGRAALVLVAVWMCILVLKALINITVTDRIRKTVAIEITHLLTALAIAAGIWILCSEKWSYNFSQLQNAIKPNLQLFTTVAVVTGLLAIGSVAGVRQIRRRLSQTWKTSIIKTVGWGMVGIVGFLTILPLVHKFPEMTSIERQPVRTESLAYARMVLLTFLGNSGWGGNDFFLIRSFWGGFGCPEPTVSLSLTQLLHGTALVSVGLATGLAILKKDYLLVVRHAGMAAIFLGYLGALAYSTAALSSPYNLHGRYMIGFYLMTIVYFGTGALSPIVEILSKDRHRSRSIVTTIGLLCFMSIHTSAIYMLLTRYYRI